VKKIKKKTNLVMGLGVRIPVTVVRGSSVTVLVTSQEGRKGNRDEEGGWEERRETPGREER
jgi:hypothetical protein